MTRARVFEVHRVGLAFLSIVPRPRGGDWLEDELKALQAEGIGCMVSLLTASEQDELGLLEEGGCCSAAGLAYLCIPVSDLAVPSDVAAFDAAVTEVLELLHCGTSVAVHCRQSIGRSGLFTCSILLALGVPAAEAMQVVSAARGVPVPETPEQRQWLERRAVQLVR